MTPDSESAPAPSELNTSSDDARAPLGPAGTYTRHRRRIMSRVQARTALVAALLLTAAGLYTLKGFLPALVWAGIFAIALWPMFDRLARRWPRHRRTLLPGAFVLAALLVFVIPVTMVAVSLASDAHAASAWAAQITQNGLAPPEFLGHLPFGSKLIPLWQQEIGQPGKIAALAGHALHGGSGQGGLMSGGLAETGRMLGAEALHRVILVGFMLLALFFALREGDFLVEQLRVGTTRAFGAAGEDVGAQVILSVHGTVNGLILVGLAEGVIMGIAYVIAGMPHPTLFGLLTALLGMVPFGAAAAFCVSALVLLASGHAVAAAVIVAVGFAVTFIADHFVRPALIGGATRLPFLWVLLGILGGVEVWGLLGLFVGPAVMAALILLWRQWVGAQKGTINPLPGDL